MSTSQTAWQSSRIRIAVVDDEERMREQLRSYLEAYARERNLSLDTVLFPSADAYLDAPDRDFDILLLDIDMPGTNGLDAARRVRKTDEDVVILFITNIAQYAINGYEVDAVDYVIKPVGYSNFAMKFQKAVRRAEKNRSSRLVIDTLKGPMAVSTEDILYVEVMAHYLIYHTVNGEYRVRASLKEHETVLKGYSFARCHKSYLINLRHLKGISTNEVAVGEFTIPMGRAYKDALMDAYLMYLHR